LIHAFFGQRDGPAIYHTYWDGGSWSRIIPVLELPEGNAGRPAIATGRENELFLLAPDNKGALYFSRGISDSAAIPSRWSTPTRLELRHDSEIGSVDVAWSASGSLYVAYSVPLNEERGIYLIQSNDNGLTWSEPHQIFNGRAAGSDFIGSPTLLTLNNGALHILWKVQLIQGDEGPQTLSLYYARSEDGGQTFSDAELLLEEPVAWQEIVTDGKGDLHLLWQGQDTMTTVWDQVSLDGGRSWQPPQALQVEGTAVALMVDSARRIHVVNAGPGSLGHWLWDGNSWKPEAPLHWPFASQQENLVELLAASANKQGHMVVVLAVPIGAVDAAEQRLLYSIHMLELPRAQTAVPEVSSKTPLPPTSTPGTPTPEPSPTPTSMVDGEPTSSQGQTDRNETTNQTSPLTIALLPVALLLLSVLGIVIRRAAQAQDR
jgi:hypothetical protein